MDERLKQPFAVVKKSRTGKCLTLAGGNHSPEHHKATHSAERLFPGCKLFTAFFHERHFIPFSKSIPAAKIPCFFLLVFFFFWYLFVISLVSDFLSIYPTHELCVYIKSWWCCERQRVSITSPTVSNDVFLGRPRAGRCWQRQQPGPAPGPLLGLAGTVQSEEHGWPGMGTPWSRWAGWEQGWFPNQMQIAPRWGTRSSPMQCAVRCLQLPSLRLFWLPPKPGHGFPMGGISCLAEQLLPLGAPSLRPGCQWKWGLAAVITINLAAFLPLSAAMEATVDKCAVRGQVPNLKWCFFAFSQGWFYQHLQKIYIWIIFCLYCHLFSSPFGNVAGHPSKRVKTMWRNTTWRAGSGINFSARCQSTRQNLNSLRWFKLPFMWDVARGMPWFAIRSLRFHTRVILCYVLICRLQLIHAFDSACNSVTKKAKRLKIHTWNSF